MADQRVQRPKSGRPALRGKPAPSPLAAEADSLQRSIGNRMTGQALENAGKGANTAVLRRMPMQVENRPGETKETLHNKTNTSGQATANTYPLGKRDIDMARGGSPEAVTVKVRTQFVNRTRGLDAAGNIVYTDNATEIPAADPRRAWAQNLAKTALARWNGKLKFKSNRMTLPFSPGGPVVLPVVFANEAVFGLAEKHDQQVVLYGQTTVANPATGNPIDAGNFYMNKGTSYGSFSDEAIYAHEYGHWIGLADEYSMSNPQAHALMHHVSPGTSANAGKALDRETVRRMVLAALTRPLYFRLSGASAEVAGALQKGSRTLNRTMTASLRAAMHDPATLTAMNGLVATDGALASKVPALMGRAVKAVTSDPRIVKNVLATEMSTASLSGMINSAYFAALQGEQSAQFNAGEAGGMSINVSGSAATGTGLYGAAASGALAGNAGGAADRIVGPAGTPGVPPVRPSTSLIRMIESLPQGWASMGGAVPPQLSSADISGSITGSATAMQLAALLNLAPKLSNRKLLGKATLDAARQAAENALTKAIRAFLASEINPVIQSSVANLSAAVLAEVDAAMATPAGALAANAPKDPDIAAAVAAMKARLDATKTASKTAKDATPGGTDLSPGKTSPGQDVTYSTANMMSSNEMIFRPDQFTHLLGAFNSKLKTFREDPFTMDVK